MERFKKDAHDWLNSKLLGKPFCGSCGLVALNNPLSQWCVDKGCNHMYHPQYKAMVKKYTSIDR